MKRRLLIVFLALVVILPLVVGEITFRLHTSNQYSEGNNALWLRHSWVGEKHTIEEYRALADKLEEMKITDAFFHSGPFDGDGSIGSDKYLYAAELIKHLKNKNPNIRLQAYLGQVEAKAGGSLDISSVSVRESILKTVEIFLDLGFDGIHYDIEPIYSGDQNFITLLRETHKLTQSRNTLLSVATCKPEPIPGLEKIVKPFAKFPGYWNRSYFLQVANEVDQIAIMSYDSGIAVPFLYGKLLSWTVDWCVDNGVSNVFIGIPTYDEITGGHYPYVENVRNALLGIKQGVEKIDKNDRRKVGTAIYAEWTTSEEEWNTYKKQWLGKD